MKYYVDKTSIQYKMLEGGFFPLGEASLLHIEVNLNKFLEKNKWKKKKWDKGVQCIEGRYIFYFVRVKKGNDYLLVCCAVEDIIKEG